MKILETVTEQLNPTHCVSKSNKLGTSNISNYDSKTNT